MATFPLGGNIQTEHQIRRSTVFWMVDFDLPNDIRERLPASEVDAINGVFCMGFYVDPIPGDRLEYRGFYWRVKERVLLAARYHKQDSRCVPSLIVEFLGSVLDYQETQADQSKGYGF